MLIPSAQDVDLLTDDLQIIGTANEIETAVTKPAKSLAQMLKYKLVYQIM
jgi:hypothetical protein